MTLIEAVKQNNQEEFFRLLNLKLDTPEKKWINEVDTRHKGSALYWAAAFGHVHFIAPLLKVGADIGKRDKDGATPLYIAAANGHAEVITILKASDADVDTPTNDGWMPIHVASEKGHAEAIRALFAAGADVNTPIPNGRTPIFVATQEDHADAIRTLPAAGAQVNTPLNGVTPVHLAAEAGYAEAITALYAAGANVNALASDGVTPVYLAAQEGHAKAITALYAARANVNTPLNDITPVHIAARNGHAEAITALYAARANVNTPMPNGVTPVHLAAEGGHAEAIRALSAAGANVNTPMLSGLTSVYIAAQMGYAAAIRALSAANADVNMPIPDGTTPIFVAAQEGHAKAIRALLAAGANVNMPISNEVVPVYCAAFHGHAEKTDTNVLYKNSVTPLQVAARGGHATVVAALLKAGAEVHIKTEGLTALKIAEKCFEENQERKYSEVIKVFAAHLKEVKEFESQAAKTAKEQQRKEKEKEKILKETEKRELMQGKTLFLDSLSTKERELQTIKTQTKAWADKRKNVQTEIFAKIIVMNEKLVQALDGRKNNERLRVLERNDSSLEEWIKLNHQIKCQGKKVVLATECFSQWVKGLQGAPSDKENATVQENFKVFSKVGEALAGEINSSKNEILKTAWVDLQKEWTLVLTEEKSLLELMISLKTLNDSLDERLKTVQELRLGTDNGALTTEVLAKISNIAASIRKKIADQKASDAVLQTAQALARSTKKTLFRSPLRSVSTPAVTIESNQGLGGEAEDAFAREPNPSVLEEPMLKKAFTEDRKLVYARMRAKQMEDLKISTERAAIEFHQSRTAIEIAAGHVPAPERTKKKEKTVLAQSALLKMYLESLGSLITRLKSSKPWRPQELYALLGSLGQVNEILVQERKNDAIARVAKRLRNAIFKQYEVIKVMLDSDQLWEMADGWYKFLQAAQTDIFQNEEDILKNLKSDPLSKVYTLGKSLDSEAKSEDEHWKIVTANIDIDKSIKSIKEMQKYWEGREVLKSGDDLINYAADDFYWAIMGSELVALTEARRRGKPGAVNALRGFKSLTPYLSEFRDRGVFARHPLTRLEEERSNVLLALENADDFCSGPSDSLPGSKKVGFSLAGRLHLNLAETKEVGDSEIIRKTEKSSFSKDERLRIYTIVEHLCKFKAVQSQALREAFKGSGESLRNAQLHLKNIRVALKKMKDKLGDIYSPQEREDKKTFQSLLQLMFGCKETSENFNIMTQKFVVRYEEVLAIAEENFENKGAVSLQAELKEIHEMLETNLQEGSENEPIPCNFHLSRVR